MAEQDPNDNQLQLQHFDEDLGVVEQEPVTTTQSETGGVTVQNHHHHQTVYYGSTIYKGDGDVIQGLKADVKDSRIESLTAPQGNSDSPSPEKPAFTPELFARALQLMEKPSTGNEKNDDAWTSVHGSTSVSPNIERASQYSMARDNSGARRKTRQSDEEFDADTDEHVYKTTQPMSPVRKLMQDKEDYQITHEEMSLIDPFVMESFSIIALKYGPDKIARHMIDMYSKEDPKDVGDLTQLLATIWKSMRLKIVSTSFERHSSGCSNFTSFLATTCLKLISQYNEANNEDKRLCEFMSCLGDVFGIGKQFASENNFIHALISSYAAANLHRISNNSYESVQGILYCVCQVRLVVEKMEKQPGIKDIVKDHVIPLMHEMKHYLQSVQVSSRNIKVEYEARCLSEIGQCYGYCGEHQQVVNINEAAIELWKRQFKDEAAKYRHYGISLCNAGTAYDKLGETEKSMEKLKMSLKAYEKTNDWFNDEEKTDLIASAENKLKEAEAKLRK